ncbi:hypothetical protein glysoja_049194 [Glycine soja]|uniref:Uncharacterized protein n=1 Tax=Glycine soja TaxID=3848 RepID=A0A0B2Q8J6_GLYSO|nr:hypothetical protein glysoja_049194 [Glycine soja]
MTGKYMNEWSNGLGHRSVYGFLEPQSIHNAKADMGNVKNILKNGLRNRNDNCT